MPASGRDYRRCVDHWNQVFAGRSPSLPRQIPGKCRAESGGWTGCVKSPGRLLIFGCSNGVPVAVLCPAEGKGACLHRPRPPPLSPMPGSAFSGRAGAIHAAGGQCGGPGPVGIGTRLTRFCSATFLDNLVSPGRSQLAYPVPAAASARRTDSDSAQPLAVPRSRSGTGASALEGNLLDDGLLLWNNTDAQWQALIGSVFCPCTVQELHYLDFDQTNRLILAEEISFQAIQTTLTHTFGVRWFSMVWKTEAVDLLLGCALLAALVGLMAWPQEGHWRREGRPVLCGNVIVPSLFPLLCGVTPSLWGWGWRNIRAG